MLERRASCSGAFPIAFRLLSLPRVMQSTVVACRVHNARCPPACAIATVSEVKEKVDARSPCPLRLADYSKPTSNECLIYADATLSAIRWFRSFGRLAVWPIQFVDFGRRCSLVARQRRRTRTKAEWASGHCACNAPCANK